MAQFLVIVRDSNQNPLAGVDVVCGSSMSMTDTTGTTTIITSTPNGQSVSIVVSAAGYTSQTSAVFATQYTQTVSFTLDSSSATARSTITVTDGTLPVVSARVFVSGVYIGQTDSNGKVTIPVSTGTSLLEIALSGYALSRTTLNGTLWKCDLL